MATKALKLPASANAQNPGAQPLAIPTISGTTISVDQMLAQPTIIPPLIRTLVAKNKGYFLDRVFSTGGFPVKGGAVIATPTKPSDEELFLESGMGIAPRAPGTEAPRLGGKRPEPKIFPVESWSGSIEITDEAKRRNDVAAVNRLLNQVANSFVKILQARAIEVLDAFVTEVSREFENKTNWATAAEAEAAKIKQSEAPATDFAYVESLLDADEAGEVLSILILHPNDAFNLYKFYGPNIDALLRSWNLTLVKSPRVTEGKGYFLADGGVGDLLYEQGLTQETDRIVRRKTTEITFEVNPVFVPLDGYKVVKLKGLAS